ncbi:MAG: hypothetical protein K2N18_02435, partial [Clostridia bacterium]|nr:hypothetical protein [Clostridia bacterium]
MDMIVSADEEINITMKKNTIEDIIPPHIKPLNQDVLDVEEDCGAVFSVEFDDLPTLAPNRVSSPEVSIALSNLFLFSALISDFSILLLKTLASLTRKINMYSENTLASLRIEAACFAVYSSPATKESTANAPLSFLICSRFDRYVLSQSSLT